MRDIAPVSNMRPPGRADRAGFVWLCLWAAFFTLAAASAALTQSTSVPPVFSTACPEDVRTLPAARLWPEYCGRGEKPAAHDGGGGPLADLSGAWHVELRGLNDGDLTVAPTLTVVLLHTDGRRLKGEELVLEPPVWTYGVILNDPDDGPYFRYMDGESQAVAQRDGVEINAGALGRQNEKLRLTLSRQPGGAFSAAWTLGDRSGAAVLQKLLPVLTSAVFRSNSKGNDLVDTPPVGTRPGKILKQPPLTCGAGNARGNCPTFFVDLYGDNLIGRHPLWLDPASRLELEPKWICKDGTTVSDWNTCLHFGGNVGLRVKVYIHNHATSGEHVLWVYGQPVRLAFTIDGEGPLTIRTAPLVFVGQSPARTISTETLTFVGRSPPVTVTTDTLIFVGQSRAHQITTDTLSFAGQSPSKAITTETLVFQGQSASHQISTDALTFVGHSPQLNISTQQLSFQGQSPAQQINSKPLTFVGKKDARP